MDITITKHNRKGRRSRRKSGQDSWDGLMMGKQAICVFCFHPQSHHQASAAMVAKPDASRRTRAGVRYIACHTCADEKDTPQVICWKRPAAWDDAARAAGLVVS